jgi:MFS family permease
MLFILSNFFTYFSKKREHGLKTVYAALLVLSLHWSLILFVDSSYLEQFLSDGHISLLYTVSSILLLIPFVYMSAFLRKVGNFRLTILFTVIEALALFGMAYATTPLLAVLFFIIHFVVGPLIFFNLDIFTEAIIGSQERQTGSARGLYLVLFGFAGAIAPLISGYLITDSTSAAFTPVYVASALLLLPFIVIITLYFKGFEDPHYPKSSTHSLISAFAKEKDTRNVFIAQFHLQFFFTWMVIYSPLYLAKVAGFSWSEIGSILFAGLMAYVIFEYPVGLIADKYIGEKEMMAFGFFLIAVSTSWLSFLPAHNLALWMFVMFLTRVGASFVEATSESYFFKHTKSSDTDKISLFRSARPLASILGALLGSYILIQVEFSFIFIILGFLMLPGIFFTLLLKDTK